MQNAKIGVVGLGTMGVGIAQLYAAAGFQVIATDRDQTMRDSARPRLQAALGPRVNAGKLAQADLDALISRITIAPDPGALAPCDMVIEAIIERLDAKQFLFRSLEQSLRAGAILATNTSAIPVHAIASGAKYPGRILGLHFFNPAPVMKLVELIAHDGTAPEALASARALTEAAGKTVIAAPDRPGFIVNRCARPFYGEALAIHEEGRSMADIDAAMRAAGYRLGPFQLIDLIGADINLAATTGLWTAMNQHPRYYPFQTLQDAVAQGRLGAKSGKPFAPAPGPAPSDAARIALRIEATLINEAAWLLADFTTPEGNIDNALRLGLNFPRGPFEALHLHSPARIRDTLAGLESAAPPHLKTRYLPAPALQIA